MRSSRAVRSSRWSLVLLLASDNGVSLVEDDADDGPIALLSVDTADDDAGDASFNTTSPPAAAEDEAFTNIAALKS